MYIISICHTFRRPRNVDRTSVRQENIDVSSCTDILAKTCILSAGFQAAKRATRIKLTALVAMYGDVQYGWIVIEGALGSITWAK